MSASGCRGFLIGMSAFALGWGRLGDRKMVCLIALVLGRGVSGLLAGTALVETSCLGLHCEGFLATPWTPTGTRMDCLLLGMSLLPTSDILYWWLVLGSLTVSF